MTSSKLYSGKGFVWLKEVRSRTGYRIAYAKDEARRERERYADLLAVRMYPSGPGCFFAGVEIKVSRQDLLTELRNPAKSYAVKRYCRHWWLAVSSNVFDGAFDVRHLIPNDWGVVVVNPPHDLHGGLCPSFIASQQVNVIRKAPVLEAEHPSMTFVASLIRNAARVS